MSHTKKIPGFIFLLLLLSFGGYVVHRMPHRVANPSDLAENAGRRVWLSGKSTMSKVGHFFDFQGTTLFLGWPNELSNSDEDIEVIGILQETTMTTGFMEQEPEYEIAKPIPADKFVFSEMLYEDTFKPLFDSSSTLATVCILLACFLISTAPVLVIATIAGVRRFPLVRIGFVCALIAHFTVLLFLNAIWLGHHHHNFGIAAKAIGVTAFASTILCTCFSVAFRRTDHSQDREIDQPKTLRAHVSEN